MAVSFGGATSWNGASESLRSLRTNAKAADKSTFTPDTPPPVVPFDPRDIERKNYNYKGLGKAALNKLSGQYDNWNSRMISNYGGSDQAEQELRNLLAIPGWLASVAKQWAANNPSGYPGAYTLAASKMTGGQPPELAKALMNYADVPDYDKTATLAKTSVPLDPVTAAKIGAGDMYAGAGDIYTGKVDKVTGEALEQLPTEPAPVIEAPKWYEGGDIGVFGGPVQPTEWTDPETGQKYRVEVSARGFGWYPVGFGKLDSPAPPDEPDDGGGYDWWNYSGFGGGGGGGGYYSAPSTYSNSNWIDRILTNWRINRK